MFAIALVFSCDDLSYPLDLVRWPVCVFALAFLHSSSPGQALTNAIYAYLVVRVSIALSLAINHFMVYPGDNGMFCSKDCHDRYHGPKPRN